MHVAYGRGSVVLPSNIHVSLTIGRPSGESWGVGLNRVAMHAMHYSPVSIPWSRIQSNFVCVKGLELIVDQPMFNYNIVLVRHC